MMDGTYIRLTPLSSSHLTLTREWANDPNLMRLLDRARPVMEQEHEAWYAQLHTHKDQVHFAIETQKDSIHIGNVWLVDIDSRHHRAELRIVMGNTQYHGKGFGTEAIQLLCDYAFRRLNLHKIYAYVLSINPPARHAFEKASFKLEGELRADRWLDDRYIDVFLMGRLRDES